MRTTKRTTLSYSRLENELRQDILSNRLSGGDALPTENELAESYGISRNSVRRALADLAAEGLVHKVHGSGTFVTPVSQRLKLNASECRSRQILFLSLSSAMSEYTFRAGATYEPIFAGLNGVLQKHGYNLLLTQVGIDWVPPACLLEGNISGIIFHGPVDEEFWRKYIRPYPNIGIQYPAVEIDSDFVAIDNYAFSKLCLNHLAEKGHRRIAFLSDEIENQPSKERFLGYLRGMQELGLPVDEALHLVWQRPYLNGVLPPHFSPPDYVPRLRPLFETDDPPTAIVCVDDFRAKCAGMALEKLGLKIPDDVSLTGSYNGLSWRHENYSGICAVLDEVCREAAALLLEQINDPAGRCGKTIRIKPRFIPGDSVRDLRARQNK